MADIDFNLMQLIIDNKINVETYVNPCKQDFAGIQNDYQFVNDGTLYEVKVSVDDEYIWFAFDSGKPNPRDEYIYDTITFEKTTNPRQESQTELLDQFFALYYFANNTLYLSNSKKKTFLAAFLKEHIKLDTIIKNFYKTPDDFIKTIKSVGKISFTDAKNLFNQNSKERQALVDLTGTDAPETFCIEATYNNGIISDFIRRMTTNTDNKISICGIDEEGFECVYNKESFCQKIAVKIKKDDKSKFDNTLVLENLLKAIK